MFDLRVIDLSATNMDQQLFSSLRVFECATQRERELGSRKLMQRAHFVLTNSVPSSVMSSAVIMSWDALIRQAQHPASGESQTSGFSIQTEF